EPRHKRGERKRRIGNAASRNPGNMPKDDEEDSQESQGLNSCPRNAKSGLLVLETRIALCESPNHFSERPELAQTLHERRAMPPLNDHLYHRLRHVYLSPSRITAVPTVRSAASVAMVRASESTRVSWSRPLPSNGQAIGRGLRSGRR